jgi:hypothetical protein
MQVPDHWSNKSGIVMTENIAASMMLARLDAARKLTVSP